IRRPACLKNEARALWESAIAPLIAAGVLSRTDVPAATAVCELWSLYKQSVKLAENDPTDKVIRVAVTDYIRAFDSLAARFGLTPIDRRKIPATQAKSQPRIASRQIAGRISHGRQTG
ncbi:MAG TPA: P27 family phage terminase small subunit, partial [Pirellulales bacterium]|nr:P27 family phage terminase small subunit [Pirellulales bacterium]